MNDGIRGLRLAVRLVCAGLGTVLLALQRADRGDPACALNAN